MEFDGDAPGVCAACANAVASGKPAPDQHGFERREEAPRRRREKVFLGFEKYDEKLLQRWAGTEIERTFVRTLPDDPGLRHAISLFERYPRQDTFLPHGQPARAWCGTWCWVVTPDGFFEDDRTACPKCAEAWRSGSKAPYQRYLG